MRTVGTRAPRCETMKLEQERLDDFQSRMSAWVSKQGLLFQLRYAGSVKGTQKSALSTFSRILLHFFVLAVVIVLSFWGYLIMRVDSESFSEDLHENIGKVLGSETIEISGLERSRGHLEIASINMIGGTNSAFEDLELSGVKRPMGLADGFLTSWSGDSLQVRSMKAYVKGGADSDEDATASYQSLFWSSKNFKLQSIMVAEANLRWGYSSSNRGQILGSKMNATRVGEGWALTFTGGEFSQNWLKHLEIDRIEAELSPDGFHIHEARLRSRDAELSFTLSMVNGGATPDFEGKGKFSKLSIADYLDEQHLKLVDGRISGTFEVSGSTNKQDGFKLTTEVVLEEGDRIELRDRIPLFRALSTADRFRSYKKVRLTTGDFRMTTVKGVLQIENLALVASRLMRLEGGFKLRPPEEDEVGELFNFERTNEVSLLSDDGAPTDEDAFSFSLRKVAGPKAEGDDEAPRTALLLNENYGSKVGQNLAKGAREREFQKVVLEGEVRIGIVAASFDHSPALSEAFPVEDGSDLRWLELPWEADSPFEIGEELAKRIFAMSGGDD
jgi:hypothetical protein